MNKIIITGNLTQDVDLRTTSTGKQVCNLSVAVNDGYGENQITTYYKVSVWNKNAENASNILHKGDKVLIEGKPSSSAYIDKQGVAKSSLEIIARVFEKLSSNSKNGETSQADTAVQKESVPEVEIEELEDDAPF